MFWFIIFNDIFHVHLMYRIPPWAWVCLKMGDAPNMLQGKWSNMKFEDKRCQTMNWWYSIYIYIHIMIYRYLRDTNDNYDTYEILWYIMIPFSDLSQSFPWDDPHVITYDTDRRRVGSSSAASRPFGKPVTCALELGRNGWGMFWHHF
jgi:hypothetical protein